MVCLVVAGLIALCAVIAWTWVASDRAAAARYQALVTRGVVTHATVLSAGYDEGGGDPGGWTSVRFAFVTAAGQRVDQTTGHHYRGSEAPGATVMVRYDPLHPTEVELTGYPRYSIDVLTGSALAATLTLGALAFTGLAFRARKRHDPSEGF
jgi:hypothetical protein